MYTLKIEHCSDQNFLERFRTDLADSAQEVVILSPFLSNNRAIHYYPILLSLTARRVSVDVYARPQQEQPESLREHYWQVESGLRRSGVSVHTRTGMHEKIGIVDKQVLWHGSLNILSHNNSRESMLRFESTDLVEEVLADLQLAHLKLAAGVYEPVQPRVVVDSPVCPICTGKMIPFEDAGLWVCERSPECKGTSRLTVDPSKQPKPLPEIQISCPLCEAPMEISRGVFLRVTCSSQDCGFSLDPRIASSLLRVLKRRGVA